MYDSGEDVVLASEGELLIDGKPAASDCVS